MSLYIGILNKFWEINFFRLFFTIIALTSSSDRLFGQDFSPTNSLFDFLSIEHVSERIPTLKTQSKRDSGLLQKRMKISTIKKNNCYMYVASTFNSSVLILCGPKHVTCRVECSKCSGKHPKCFNLTRPLPI